ncbi:MAG TPA: APC family permease [Bryobacteraceae bacterium]|nr:APC family permease [Bryobacteraceae bacterium]
MAEQAPALRREIGLWDLVLFNIAAVAGVRWLSAAAHAGPGSITLWLVAVVFFFVPSALVVSSLSRKFPQEGGLYVWSREAFGDWHGFLCAWYYLISNIIYFPTLILAGVSMAAYMFGAGEIAETRRYALPVTFAVLWAVFLANLFGMKLAKWTGNLGGASTWVVSALLVGFAVPVLLKFGSATKFHIVPAVTWDSVNFWSQIAFAFVGLEVGAILGGEIRRPDWTIPRAAMMSGAICTAFYIAGTSALLVLMPPAHVSVMTGLTQAGQITGERLGVWWLGPVFAALVTVGTFGQLGSYVAGNTRLPFAIGLDRYMPAAFARLHPRWGTPHVSILTQAVLCSLLLVAMEYGETLRGAYQTLVDMCVITTFVPFLYLFGAGARFGRRVAGAAGFAVSLLAIVVSLVPPPDVPAVWRFELKVAAGLVVTGLVGRWIFKRSRAAWD